jgi:hypothetical protein
MEALRRPAQAATASASLIRSPSPVWTRQRAWALRARRRQQQNEQTLAVVAARASASSSSASASSSAPPPWQQQQQMQQQQQQQQQQRAWAPPPVEPDQDASDEPRRRALLRELLGGLRDDDALAALDARAPGAAAFTPSALALTLDALGAVLGLERRHLLRVVALAPGLLTDPSRARRVVASLGRVLGTPRPSTDVAAYGRAFPSLLALAPDDDDGDGDSDGDDEQKGQEAAGASDAGLNARVRALAGLLVAGGADEAAFRAWMREYPPRAAALLSQPAAEVEGKLSRLEAAFAAPPAAAAAAVAAAAGGGGAEAPPRPQEGEPPERAAARLLALARPMLLDVGPVVLRSRVVALAEAGRVGPRALAALALAAGGRDSQAAAAAGAGAGAVDPPPLVPPGVQGLAELLLCAPQRLSEWSDVLAGLLLPPPEEEAASAPRQPQQPQQRQQRQQDALPLAAIAAAPGQNPRAFALEALLLIGARNPSDVIVRWRAVQTAAWRRRGWRRELERRWGAREVAAALSARHDQLARVAFLASASGPPERGDGDEEEQEEEVGLMEAIRGTADFDKRFPAFRRWLESGE